MVADLVRECLDVDPARRPSMEAILRRLLVRWRALCRALSWAGQGGGRAGV